MDAARQTFGRNLRALREARQFTQAALGHAVGASQGAVGNWERGASWPTLDVALALAEALEVNLANLADPAWTAPTPAEAEAVRMVRALGLDADEVIRRLAKPAGNPGHVHVREIPRTPFRTEITVSPRSPAPAPASAATPPPRSRGRTA